MDDMNGKRCEYTMGSNTRQGKKWISRGLSSIFLFCCILGKKHLFPPFFQNKTSPLVTGYPQQKPKRIFRLTERNNFAKVQRFSTKNPHPHPQSKIEQGERKNSLALFFLPDILVV
jgi:hypothetical protein